jgi:hypothetical protein
VQCGVPDEEMPRPPGAAWRAQPATRRGSWTAQLDRCSIKQKQKMIRPWFRQAAVPWKTTATQTRASGENRVSTKLGVLQYEKDGMLIIPVALVAGGGGGGTARSRRDDSAARPGAPPGAGQAGPGPAPGDPGRADAGGGFGGLLLPSGAYVVKADQVRWVPAVDVTIVVVASLSLVRVLARTWTRRSRRHGRR